MILVQGIMRNNSVIQIILNLDKWFRRRCHLKDFLSGTLATLLSIGVEPFVQFW